MLWDPFLYCINDSIQGSSETGNRIFDLPYKVSINNISLKEKKVSPVFKYSTIKHFLRNKKEDFFVCPLSLYESMPNNCSAFYQNNSSI